MAIITIVEALDKVSEATKEYIDSVVTTEGLDKLIPYAEDNEVDAMLKEVLKAPKR